MEDQIVSLETAQLAKNNNFDLAVSSHYLSDGKFSSIKGKYPNGRIDNLYAAPTQSLLQRWLREKHKYYIQVMYNKRGNFSVMLVDSSDNVLSDTLYGETYSTYEEALEKGLVETLKLI
jgi:hypothetical protein